MTLPVALAKASEVAKRRRRWIYVFEEDGGFDFGTDEDADTFWCGQEAVAVFGPDGMRQD